LTGCLVVEGVRINAIVAALIFLSNSKNKACRCEDILS